MASFVQGVSQDYTTQAGGTQTLAFGSNNTVGNFLICFINHADHLTPTFSDTAGNSWTTLTDFTTTDVYVSVAVGIAKNCKAGANTVQVAFGGSSFATMSIAEFSGLNSFDVNAGVNGPNTASASWVSNNLTTNFATEAIFGWAVSRQPSLTVSSPFNNVIGVNRSFFIAFYQLVSSLQTGISASGTQYSATPENQCSDIFSFYLAAGLVDPGGMCGMIF
jgi:hypothetical protein